MLSLVVGIVLVTLGSVCIVAAVTIATIEALAPKLAAQGAFPVSIQDLTKLLQVIVDMLKAFAQLKVAGQFMVIGLVLFGLGIWVLAAKPI